MKYDSDRDQYLSEMVTMGWANTSSGDVESPQGFFALIINEASDEDSIRDLLDEMPWSFDYASMVGFFVMVENSQGFVTVYSFDTEAEARAFYDAKDNAYGDWAGDDYL